MTIFLVIVIATAAVIGIAALAVIASILPSLRAQRGNSFLLHAPYGLPRPAASPSLLAAVPKVIAYAEKII